MGEFKKQTAEETIADFVKLSDGKVKRVFIIGIDINDSVRIGTNIPEVSAVTFLLDVTKKMLLDDYFGYGALRNVAAKDSEV